jgi:hypothetical protein
MNHNQPGDWRCAFCRDKIRLSKLELAVYVVGSACIGMFLGVIIFVVGGG